MNPTLSAQKTSQKTSPKTAPADGAGLLPQEAEARLRDLARSLAWNSRSGCSPVPTCGPREPFRKSACAGSWCPTGRPASAARPGTSATRLPSVRHRAVLPWDPDIARRYGAAGPGGAPQGRRRRARPDDQPAPLAARRPALRGLQRGPGAHRRARRRLRDRRAGQRRRRHAEALRRQRFRDRPLHR